ncbi:ABC-2 transporter permease [Roseburia hominis]
MKGLIIKDLTVYKRTLKKSNLIFEFALFLALLFFNHYIGLFLFNIVILLTSGMAVAGIMFNDDSASKWEKFMIVLPVSKKDIIFSRFAAVWVILGIEFVEVLLFNILSAVIHAPAMLTTYISFAVIGFLGAFVLSAISLTINYLKDDKLSGVVGMMTIIVAIIVSFLVYQSGVNIIDVLNTSKTILLLLALLGAIVSFVVSFYVSVWGFSRKHS